MAVEHAVSRRARVLVALALALVIGAAPGASAQSADYDEVYFRFLNTARKAPPSASMWMSDLTSDRRAQRVNDLVTVRVLESLTATGTADSTVSKGSDAAVGLPSPASKALAKLLPTSSSTKFNGAGGTTRTTELSAALTARVTEVLPTGDMVIEGIREVDINGDRNVVVLSGVVRSADIQPGNVVLSTHIGQLRIRSLSQGLIRDSLEPGWLIKILNRIF